MFRYGRQQIFSRYDPSSIEEGLGDDPVKASTYGIKNLKYILANLDKWIDKDPDYKQREDLYKDICNQYFRYITNVAYNVGGIYLNSVKEGTPGKKYVPVPKQVQRASLAWILNEFRNSDWISNTPLRKEFSLDVKITPVLRNKLAGSLKQLTDNVILSAHISDNPYRVDEFLNDLFKGAFENTLKGARLTEADKILQKTVVNMVLIPLEDKKVGAYSD